jgi:hypothetical protein
VKEKKIMSDVLPLKWFFSFPDGKNQPYIYCDKEEANNKHVHKARKAGETAREPLLKFEIPGIFNPVLENKISRGVFSIEKLDPDKPNNKLKTRYLIKLNESVWDFTEDPVRQQILSDFTGFLKELEPYLIPGGLDVVRAAVCGVLPMTFSEALFFYHGLDFYNEPGTASGYCHFDLSPAVRLRIDFQANQFVHSAIQDGQQYLNGFVGSGSSYLYVNNYFDTQSKNFLMGFDPFLNLVQNTVVGGEASPQGGGAIDLKRPVYRKKYFRILYPNAFPASFSNGFAGIGENVTFIGADSLSDIEEATERYRTHQTLDGFTGGKTPVVSFYFRGRTCVIPEIAVLFNNTPIYVSLGTTYRQVLSRFVVIPRTTDHEYLHLIQGLKFYRNIRPRLVSEDYYPDIAFPLHAEVAFSLADPELMNRLYTPSYDHFLDPFDVPLVHGDQLAFEAIDLKYE